MRPAGVDAGWPRRGHQLHEIHRVSRGRHRCQRRRHTSSTQQHHKQYTNRCPSLPRYQSGFLPDSVNSTPRTCRRQLAQMTSGLEPTFTGCGPSLNHSSTVSPSHSCHPPFCACQNLVRGVHDRTGGVERTPTGSACSVAIVKMLQSGESYLCQ